MSKIQSGQLHSELFGVGTPHCSRTVSLRYFYAVHETEIKQPN